jgi:hypothetical protein
MNTPDIKELAARLELACQSVNSELIIIHRGDREGYKRAIEEKMDKAAESFFKKHKDEKLIESLRLVLDMYKRKCLQDFESQQAAE